MSNALFPYDAVLVAAFSRVPQSVAQVIETMQTVESTCAAGDGLRWFNWLYLRVTEAIQTRLAAGGFSDEPWLAELDVQFARLYFQAVANHLSDRAAPDCWQILCQSRRQTGIARVQFALSGVNAHINHDLPMAVVATCEARGTAPVYADPHYCDYTSLNSTFDSLIETAKQALDVRLLGDALPPVTHLEDTLAAWNVAAAREGAWHNAELLWHLRGVPELSAALVANLDGLTTVAGKALLVPVPTAP